MGQLPATAQSSIQELTAQGSETEELPREIEKDKDRPPRDGPVQTLRANTPNCSLWPYDGDVMRRILLVALSSEAQSLHREMKWASSIE